MTTKTDKTDYKKEMEEISKYFREHEKNHPGLCSSKGCSLPKQHTIIESWNGEWMFNIHLCPEHFADWFEKRSKIKQPFEAVIAIVK